MILSGNQIRKLQHRLEFIEDSKIFQDSDSPSSSGSAHVSLGKEEKGTQARVERIGLIESLRKVST